MDFAGFSDSEDEVDPPSNPPVPTPPNYGPLTTTKPSTEDIQARTGVRSERVYEDIMEGEQRVSGEYENMMRVKRQCEQRFEGKCENRVEQWVEVEDNEREVGEARVEGEYQQRMEEEFKDGIRPVFLSPDSSTKNSLSRRGGNSGAGWTPMSLEQGCSINITETGVEGEEKVEGEESLEEEERLCRERVDREQRAEVESNQSAEGESVIEMRPVFMSPASTPLSRRGGGRGGGRTPMSLPPGCSFTITETGAESFICSCESAFTKRRNLQRHYDTCSARDNSTPQTAGRKRKLVDEFDREASIDDPDIPRKVFLKEDSSGVRLLQCKCFELTFN